MKTHEVSALCWVPHVHEHLGEVRATIRGLPMRRQVQRDTVTCLRSHSMEVLVLTVEPLCFPQVAQGNLQPPAPHTPRKGQLGGQGDGQVGWDPGPSLHTRVGYEGQIIVPSQEAHGPSKAQP